MISRKIVYNILTFLLTITLIFGVSIFTYGTFYFAYMPSEVFALNIEQQKVSWLPVSGLSQVHDEEINFQFSPCQTSPGACSFPNASLMLDRRRHRLMAGQPYRLSLSLELPESSENQVPRTQQQTHETYRHLTLLKTYVLLPSQQATKRHKPCVTQ